MGKNLQKKANANLLALVKNPYLGRGIIMGLDESGKFMVQVYWIQGRSSNSRNRIFVCNNKLGTLRTTPADLTKVKDLSLIIYQAMAQKDGLYVVSNGNQTETIMEFHEKGMYLYSAMLSRSYEPDSPNFTPRISGIFFGRLEQPWIEMSILRKSLFGNTCERHLYRYEEFFPGLGYCLTTYSGDGDPLPSFRGEPYLLPILGNIDDVLQDTWQALDEDNRVSIAVKFIGLKTGKSLIKVINKYKEIL